MGSSKRSVRNLDQSASHQAAGESVGSAIRALGRGCGVRRDRVPLLAGMPTLNQDEPRLALLQGSCPVGLP